MLDTHAIARSLTDAGIPAAQADAITDAVRTAAESADYATRADLLALELRIVKWVVGTGAAVAGTVIAAVAALLRLLG